MIAGYVTDEQRGQTRWIGVQKWEFILVRALGREDEEVLVGKKSMLVDKGETRVLNFGDEPSLGDPVTRWWGHLG